MGCSQGRNVRKNLSKNASRLQMHIGTYLPILFSTVCLSPLQHDHPNFYSGNLI
ncbi:unnamed protein product [Amoebophrya sp. A120]|nr:unnamed protein product [Amoebophrya sp. A120]|eukprot:GSA120T00025735001.1